MVRTLVSAVLAFALWVCAAPDVADADRGRAPAGGRELPVSLRSYATGELAARPAVPATDRASAGLREASLASGLGDAANGRPKGYEAVLFSLLIPGTGEIYLGYYWRGIALVGIEAAAWYGYASYRNDGLDERQAYEAYADVHWSESRWIGNHPANECVDSTTTVDKDYLTTVGNNPCGGWPGWHSWAPKEEQKQNYYENIGKYDWFISGWSDWDPVGKPMDTAVRDTYRAMRKQSNDDLDTADRFIYLSMAARVFSLVETVLLLHGNKKAQEGATSSHSLEIRSTGLYSAHIAYEYRFR